MKEKMLILEELRKQLDHWEGFVCSAGNECAYTDRILEYASELLEKLKKIPGTQVAKIMTIHEVLDFFDFELEKYENGYGVIDMQGANLGDIESERFKTFGDILDRFANSIYIEDYIDKSLEEHGYHGEYSWESQYNWCVENDHPYADICYTFMNSELVTE